MSTLRVNTLQDATGSNQPAMAGAAKAWVNFDGSGTVAIRGQFNVSSITDNGTGLYTVNFATPMQDVNYSVKITSTNPYNTFAGEQLGLVGTPNSTSSIQIRNANTGTAYDTSIACVAVFR